VASPATGKAKIEMVNLKNAWRNIWNDDGTISYRRNLFIFLLAFSSFLYRRIIKLRDLLYRMGFFKEEKLPGRVISIGNIIV
jgi:tetraacyldisaccharide-1-P 4'-kinase